MAVNHVEKSNGEPIIDLRDANLKPEAVFEGYSGYGANGELIHGTAKVSSEGETGENVEHNLHIPIVIDENFGISEIESFDTNAFVEYLLFQKKEKIYVSLRNSSNAELGETMLYFSCYDENAQFIEFIGDAKGIKYSCIFKTFESTDQIPNDFTALSVDYMDAPIFFGVTLDVSLSNDIYLNVSADLGADSGTITLTPTDVRTPDDFLQKVQIAINNQNFGSMLVCLNGSLLMPMTAYDASTNTVTYGSYWRMEATTLVVTCAASLVTSDTGDGFFVDLGNGIFMQIVLSVSF